MMNDALYSSASPDWYTPPHILVAVRSVMGTIDIDPCADEASFTDATTCFTESINGLHQAWFGRVYMNSPYGTVIGEWVRKFRFEYEAGRMTEGAALAPVRTDTQWWEAINGYTVCFLKGRLRFWQRLYGPLYAGRYPVALGGTAPFPSAVIYVGPNIHKFTEEFNKLGAVYVRA